MCLVLWGDMSWSWMRAVDKQICTSLWLVFRHLEGLPTDELVPPLHAVSAYKIHWMCSASCRTWTVLTHWIHFSSCNNTIHSNRDLKFSLPLWSQLRYISCITVAAMSRAVQPQLLVQPCWWSKPISGPNTNFCHFYCQTPLSYTHAVL